MKEELDFNEWLVLVGVKIYASEAEDYDNAEQACMKMYEETGAWEWISAAARMAVDAEDARAHALEDGWYVV